MSLHHCSCGFAINDTDEFGDHLRAVFDRGDDTGTDGNEHYEKTDDGRDGKWVVCACGFETADPAEFDDHTLLVFFPPDGIGNDGKRHVPVDPSTPDRWYVPGTPGE